MTTKTQAVKATIKIVEERTVRGAYDMPCRQAILDHSEHGRLLITKGFCGMDDLRGGQYRWEGGCVITLLPDDTFEALEDAEWNDWTSLFSAVLGGYDKTRPVWRSHGKVVHNLAVKAGL